MRTNFITLLFAGGLTARRKILSNNSQRSGILARNQMKVARQDQNSTECPEIHVHGIYHMAA
jgi:hypothetical protein